VSPLGTDLCADLPAARRQRGGRFCRARQGTQTVLLSGGDRAPLAHFSARRDSAVLFADSTEEQGPDYSQFMNTQAQVALLDPGDAGLRLFGARTAPPAGEVATPDARTRVIIVAVCLTGCMSRSFLAFTLTLWLTSWPPDAAQLMHAKREIFLFYWRFVSFIWISLGGDCMS
jgi:hypothetical protein